ncbi:protein ALP1-like [Humulus lupulus]|uniref:protein ALP1-like n=1 Tax=Humulus lupulus TaxID=3486 RepID=UPI002B41848B|nr:protein ALP1-like [Humulus lupulus]
MADTDEEIELQSASIATYFVQHYYTTYIEKTPCMNSSQTGHMWLMEILKGHESRCYSMFRMEKDVFIKICDELEANYGFKGSKRMCALEILGMFLFTLGHGAGNRLTQERFQHSGETVSRYFNKVLDVLCHMSVDVLKPPDPEFKDVPEEILKDSRYMPHFKNCIGAIDGVHVNAVIPPEDQVPFVGRKGIPTQNVMAICNFDMQFIYAYAGWEGSAHDTRIFYTALRDSTSNFPKPPQGKYYLVDAGYPQITGFLGPYKGQRYHLPQFQRGSKPTGYKEVFNQAHSSLRSVIERTFGVWKKRWKILRDMPSYPYQKQVKIVIASMTLHNYIRRHAKRDRHFEKIRDNPYYCVEDQTNIEDEDETARASNLNEMDNTRDLIAASLMGYN